MNMRTFAATWPDRQIVQEVLAQITWPHNIALLEKVESAQTRLWYAGKAREYGPPTKPAPALLSCEMEKSSRV